MSYELDSKCGECSKKDTCTDGEIIRNGVNLTHQMPIECHQGFGKITHECNNFVEDLRTPEEDTATDPA